jgi:hypothetical protein
MRITPSSRNRRPTVLCDKEMEDFISDRDSILGGLEKAIQEVNEEAVEEDKE